MIIIITIIWLKTFGWVQAHLWGKKKKKDLKRAHCSAAIFSAQLFSSNKWALSLCLDENSPPHPTPLLFSFSLDVTAQRWRDVPEKLTLGHFFSFYWQQSSKTGRADTGCSNSSVYREYIYQSRLCFLNRLVCVAPLSSSSDCNPS